MAFPFSLADLLAAINTNPVGTERFGGQSMTAPSPDTVPATTWGGYPVSQRLYNAGQNAIGNAMGWVGGTETPGIRAFHGSPYDFNAFDMSKIGTGEGAQAYGHGLYFAGNEGVARDYRNRLTDAGYARVTGGLSPAEEYVHDMLSKDSSEMDILRGLAGRGHSFDTSQAAIDRVKSLNAGKMYEVNLNVQPQQLLDWDKPISQQPQSVQDQLSFLMHAQQVPRGNNAGGETTGGQLYNYLSNRFGGDQGVASQELHGEGIKGIQYLDQGSRNPEIVRLVGGKEYNPADPTHGAAMALSWTNGDRVAAAAHLESLAGKDATDKTSAFQMRQAANVLRTQQDVPPLTEGPKPGTHNYVMFDPSLIEILRKYLFPVTTVGGTAALASQQGSNQ